MSPAAAENRVSSFISPKRVTPSLRSGVGKTPQLQTTEQGHERRSPPSRTPRAGSGRGSPSRRNKGGDALFWRGGGHSPGRAAPSWAEAGERGSRESGVENPAALDPGLRRDDIG